MFLIHHVAKIESVSIYRAVSSPLGAIEGIFSHSELDYVARADHNLGLGGKLVAYCVQNPPMFQEVTFKLEDDWYRFIRHHYRGKRHKSLLWGGMAAQICIVVTFEKTHWLRSLKARYHGNIPSGGS